MSFYGVRTYTRKCPQCKYAFSFGITDPPIRLGPSLRKCTQCGASFRDNAKEWNLMTSKEKTRYLFDDWKWFGIVTLFLVSVSIYQDHDPLNLVVIALLIALGMSPLWLIAIPIRLIKIAISLRRCRTRATQH
jgi:hypothetical protein